MGWKTSKIFFTETNHQILFKFIMELHWDNSQYFSSLLKI